MVAGVRTVAAEGRTVEEAVDRGGQALAGTLYTTNITADEVIAMSAQTVYDPDGHRWLHVVTLVLREKQQDGE